MLAVYTASGCVPPRSEDSAVRTFVLMRGETDRQAALPGLRRHARRLGRRGTASSARFEQPRIAYLRRPSEVSYYANHVWADSPSRMVLPLLVRSLDDRTLADRGADAHRNQRRLPVDLSGLVVQQEFLQQPSRSRGAGARTWWM